MQEQVDLVFERLRRGQVTASPPGPEDGWEATLPSGDVVTRSRLQREAAPLVSLGADALPSLLPKLDEPNAALRYVAIFALEQITGERPSLSYFDDADESGDRARAAELWRAWYERRRGPAASH